VVVVGAWLMVSANGCVAGAPTPLLAVRVQFLTPMLPGAAEPASVALPLPLLVRFRPPGRAGAQPVSVSEALGKPVLVNVKVPGVPTINAVLLALVIAGAWLTVRVKF